MNLCPICHSEMIKGCINVSDENFQFFPLGIKPPFMRTKWNVTQGATLIKRYSAFDKKAIKDNFYAHPACMCPSCQKIIIDVEKQ